MPDNLKLVLFDLDGTLVDTAPDLGGTINRMLTALGKPAQPISLLRPAVSQGAKGLIERGFGISSDHPDFPDLLAQFLSIYEQNICVDSALFPGMSELLEYIEDSGRYWGVVTNKRSRFTLPLMEQLGLAKRASCIVSADSTAEPKPSALPMLYALEKCQSDAKSSIYIGDDERDVIAGKAANMLTAAITYGYHSEESQPMTWGADYLFDSPSAVHQFLRS